MRNFYTRRKRIAISLLAIWLVNLLTPAVSLALTSGPGQPESKSFQAAGVTDMVDLSTGDMKYNIPLMDVEGYPLNLSYKSGVGMDDEASWVGLGWNINVGAINRQLRGLPDDFSGDEVITEHYTKPKITIGGRGNAKIELGGSAKITPSLSFTLGIFSDNYTGIGAEVGANAGISFSFVNSGFLTAGLGVGVLSSTASGVDVSPNVSLSVRTSQTQNFTTSAKASLSQGYNTRSGLKSLSLGSSFSLTGRETVQREVKDANGNPEKDAEGNTKMEDFSYDVGSASLSVLGTTISYNTEPVSPKISIPYKTTYDSYSIDAGGSAWFIFGGGGLTGYKSVREVYHAKPFFTKAYGFLYADKGKDDPAALMDFIREKDNPMVEGIPNLAVPVHTPDLFSYTSQAGGGQFRVYRDGTGVLGDNQVVDHSSMTSAGADFGFGGYFHGGITVFDQQTYNKAGKWTADNNYLPVADFQADLKGQPHSEKAYFKLVGEHSYNDTEWKRNSYFNGEKPVAISLNGTAAENRFQDQEAITSPIISAKKQPRRTAISYLTAGEAKAGALDKQLVYHPFIGKDFDPTVAYEQTSVNRDHDFRKKDHISEITVTDEGGKRMVYGMPVYNKYQEEHSFAIKSSNNKAKNLISFNEQDIKRENGNGLDHFYHKERQPAYASSFLLTGILSPDYVDVDKNGISEKDLGTAVKFNYSKKSSYFWRSPMWDGGNGNYAWATHNKGLMADSDDDKASVVYGEKELCFLHSIETKTKIVYFITEDRQDGLGVMEGMPGLLGQLNPGVKQRKLVEIRLYSKGDLTHPMKVVKFDHDYSLCEKTPNSQKTTDNPNKGKLTLKKVSFEYGESSNGKNHPYEFTYNHAAGGNSITYQLLNTDRWGMYKNDPVSGELPNDEFPYTRNQTAADRTANNEAAALWQLKEIRLPSGGKIRVEYEADDYAYVQDKRAMVMTPVSGLVDDAGNPTSSLGSAGGIKVEIAALSTKQKSEFDNFFRKAYLNGSDYLYGRYKVDVTANKTTANIWDFIPCHAKVREARYHQEGEKSYAIVLFDQLEERGESANPILMLAWQHIKNNYPKYAYPGYENRAKDGDVRISAEAAIDAIGAAFNNLDELKQNFYEKAREGGYANNINVPHSFVRLVQQNGFKAGGGSRVRAVRIDDNWSEMGGGESRSYGQFYSYQATTEQGRISSGVAAYEPSIGNDENPLKQAIPYKHSVKGGIGNFLDLEEPFGESLFPAPEVVYSKVTVQDLDSPGEPDPAHIPETGYMVNEFYTAKDFPVRVSFTTIKPYVSRPHSRFSFLEANSEHKMTLTQGYSIELNDMHGKSRATRTYNKANEEIASTVYSYNTSPAGDGSLKLSNVVNIVNEKGDVSSAVIARDIEFFTDMREQETINEGQSLNLGVDVIPVMGFPGAIPHIPASLNRDYMLFRSACALKVVQYYGVVQKVTKTENGSSLSTENLAYDGITGEPLVTRTQDQNDTYVYSVNMPAYWVYKGMGGAYQNLGTVLYNVTTSAENNSVNLGYRSLLSEGDVLLGSDEKEYYVTDRKTLINNTGLVFVGTLSLAKVIRSGYRNRLSSPTFSITCARNPIFGNKLDIFNSNTFNSLNVLNMSAIKYSQEWAYTNMKVENTTSSEEVYSPQIYRTNVYQYDPTRPSSDYEMTPHNPPHLNQHRPVHIISEWHGVLWGGDDVGFYNTKNSSLAPRRAGSSIWYKDPVTQAAASEVGLTTKFNTPINGIYVLGCSGSNYVEVSIDGGTTLNQNYFKTQTGKNNYLSLHTFPLAAGNHTIKITGYGGGTKPSLSVEIYNYNNTSLLTALEHPATISTIFSTDYANTPIPADYLVVNGVRKDRLKTHSYTNPFFSGAIGNWRPSESKTWLGDRKNSGAGKVKGSGYLLNAFPFWLNNGTFYSEFFHNNWVTSNSITLYDEYGQEVENKDALGRYSAANFIFNGELPSVVASNAEYREIYSCGFEDKFLKEYRELPHLPQLPDFVGPNVFNHNVDPAVPNSNREAHTGHYSYAIPSTGLKLSSIFNSHGKNNIIEGNADGEYKFKNGANMVNRGFEPGPFKKYIISAWVKDVSQGFTAVVPNNMPLTTLSINNINVPLKCAAVIEGWKLIKTEFAISPSSSNRVSMIISRTVDGLLIDDIRIHPADSHMKTFAYSFKSFKLMAELDENNFATFYEYDDEGSLVRVKKETQRGIVTLKENHSSQFSAK